MDEETERAAAEVVGAAYRVHKALGPGLLESVYERCLCHELSKRSVAFNSQLSMPVRYDGIVIESGLRVDLLVANRVVVELKAAERDNPLFASQLLTYLRLSGLRLGLLVNFNVVSIRHGIRRLSLPQPSSPSP
jgi:GxxExxY protein